MKLTELLKKILSFLVNIVKGIVKLLQDYMKSQWDQWDKESEKNNRRGKKK